MELLIVLIKVGGILSFAYLAAVYLYKYVAKVSTADAQGIVHKAIKDELAILFNKQSQAVEPVPDEIIRAEILDILASANKLKKDFTKWQFCKNFYGFPALRFNIVACANADFDLLIIQLKKVTENYLQLCGHSPCVHVYTERCSDAEYFIYVCYACFSPAQTALQNFIMNKADIAKKDCIKKEAPVINETLEKELEDMKNGLV